MLWLVGVKVAFYAQSERKIFPSPRAQFDIDNMFLRHLINKTTTVALGLS
jgi:hypothetical protein